MASVAAHFERFQFSRRSISPALIEHYKETHDEMLAAISAMDELTQGEQPNFLRFSYTRLRITRASLECRRAFAKIVARLAPDARPAAARVLETLEGRHFELKELTSVHVTAWTPPRIQSDWASYCRASAEVRRRWRQIIESERQLLYPLL